MNDNLITSLNKTIDSLKLEIIEKEKELDDLYDKYLELTGEEIEEE